MMRKTHLLLLMLLFILPMMVSSAQSIERGQVSNEGTCPALVETALEAVDEFCANTGRNQACYGNFNLEAEARPTAENFRFETIGDIANVIDIASLRLNGMDEASGEWGVALLRLQTNLPDTLPGQNVTFILFGDVEITNAVDETAVENGEMTPMQAFYLTTGIGDARCNEAPDSGLIVQTPEGVGEVAFTVNEVDIQMGSTVLFQANADGEDGEMVVTTIEGAAALSLDGQTFPVIEGTMARMPLRRIEARLRAVRLPELIETYDERRLQGLPLRVLQRRIEAVRPLDQQTLLQVRQRFRDGMAMCGEAPFPSCDHIPHVIGGLPCILPSMVDRLSEEQRAGRPLCDVEELPLDQLPPRGNRGERTPVLPVRETVNARMSEVPLPTVVDTGNAEVPRITPTPIRVFIPTPTPTTFRVVPPTAPPVPTLPPRGGGGFNVAPSQEPTQPPPRLPGG